MIKSYRKNPFAVNGLGKPEKWFEMKKILVISLFLIFGLPNFLFGATWYVRPAGGSYGLENGKSYENAWDGFLNVIWGAGGVQAGDTLYVCGIQVFRYDGKQPISTAGQLAVSSGRDDNARVMIRGDYPSDPGTVWGAYIPTYESWVNEGNNTWSIILKGNHQPDDFFQDVTTDSFTVLNPVSSLDKCKATPGTHYSHGYGPAGTKLYVHCSDNGDPNGRVALNSYGYHWNLGDYVKSPTQKYITLKNLKLYNFAWNNGTTKTYITLDGCRIWHTYWNAISLVDYSHDVKILNCDIAYAPNGIYNVSATNNSPYNYTFSGNRIHDIGVRSSYQNGDAHAIGIQGGHDGIIEGNIIENCGTGPLLHAFTNQELKNVVVRRNFIKNLHQLGGARGYGISTMCNNDSFSDKSGNQFYQNIVINSPVAFRFQFEHEQKVFNNVAYNCDVGIESGRNFNGLGANVDLKNNIFMNSKKYHVNWFSGGNTFVINFGHNLYYPVDGKKFRIGSKELTFYQWKVLGLPGCTFDSKSVTEDPLFANTSGSYSKLSDFELRPKSPAINAGVPVGLTKDFEGKSIANLPAIGAFEYHIPMRP